MDYLIQFLKQEGFTIQKYEAYSSNSVYLKLDYGVCHSIRISDHHGKKHLSYRYNILQCVEEPYVNEKSEYPRYYYSFDDVEMMLERIIDDRNKRLSKYGENLYTMFMKSNKENKQYTVGFWSKAKLV